MTRALEGLQTAMASEKVIEKPELVASFEDILDLTKFEFPDRTREKVRDRRLVAGKTSGEFDIFCKI